MSRLNIFARGAMPVFLALTVPVAQPPAQAPAGTGTFSATITGKPAGKIQGTATFEPAGPYHPDAPAHFIQLVSANTKHRLTFARDKTGLPPVGTYRIANADSEADNIPTDYYAGHEWLFSCGPEIEGDCVDVFSALSGTVRITVSTSTQLAGTFSFRAKSDEGGLITVQGAFSARRGIQRPK